MKNEFNDEWKRIKNKQHFSKDCLYKLLLSDYFNNYKKIIISDVDVIYLKDISESYFTFDGTSKLYAGIKILFLKNKDSRIFLDKYKEHFKEFAANAEKICGGYILANLEELRKQKCCSKYIKFLNKHAAHLIQPEQDTINFCTKEEDIHYLPLEYCTCTYHYGMFIDDKDSISDDFYSLQDIKYALKNPRHLHYACVFKPWATTNTMMSCIWFSYLKKTGFYLQYKINIFQKYKYKKQIWNWEGRKVTFGYLINRVHSKLHK